MLTALGLRKSGGNVGETAELWQSVPVRCDIRNGRLKLDDDSLPLVLIHPESPMAEMRDVIMATLDDLGFGNAQPLGEQLLFHDRCYVGVRFVFEGMSAIWLVDADQLRFVDDKGKLLKIVRFDGSHRVEVKAA